MFNAEGSLDVQESALKELQNDLASEDPSYLDEIVSLAFSSIYALRGGPKRSLRIVLTEAFS